MDVELLPKRVPNVESSAQVGVGMFGVWGFRGVLGRAGILRVVSARTGSTPSVGSSGRKGYRPEALPAVTGVIPGAPQRCFQRARPKKSRITRT